MTIHVTVQKQKLADLYKELETKYPDGPPCKDDGVERYPECIEFHILISAISLAERALERRQKSSPSE